VSRWRSALASLGVVLLLTGCGGNDFQALFSENGGAPETDTGTGGTGGMREFEKPSTGGALEADDAGRPSANTGGMAAVVAGDAGGAGGSTAATCPVNEKLCGGTCVAMAPTTGCLEITCDPCGAPPDHAHTICANGQCTFDCDEGYQRVADACMPACQQSTHSDGRGQMWTDCAPTGTYTQDQATKACEAWCAINGGCHCEIGMFCADNEARIYAPSGTSFLTWVWQGSDAGNVVQADPGSAGKPACTTVSSWQ